jgi:hypothetical protein
MGAIWMHGNAAVAENPERLNLFVRKGWGTHFGQASGSNWIHIPVGQRGLTASATIAFVLFRTTNAAITALHVHDGFNVIAKLEGQRRSGDALQISDATSALNAWPLGGARLINNGLGLSIEVEFAGGGEILIAAAGAYVDDATA